MMGSAEDDGGRKNMTGKTVGRDLGLVAGTSAFNSVTPASSFSSLPRRREPSGAPAPLSVSDQHESADAHWIPRFRGG